MVRSSSARQIGHVKVSPAANAASIWARSTGSKSWLMVT